MNGRPFKVVKYASDVTRQVNMRRKSEHVRTMMEAVAAGAEELNSSVQEISSAMVKSQETAAAAAGHVREADQQAQRLADAARSMSGIVELIHDITGQINLLALNATIKSARAGEAGRGFAIVASEVRSLASQAKEAALKINREIESLNGISADVVVALNTIHAAMEDVSKYVMSTSVAMEQQSIVSREMTSNMHQAAAEAANLA